MKAKAKNADKRNKKKQAPKKQKYNPHRQPEKMTTEEWQRATIEHFRKPLLHNFFLQLILKSF